MEVFCEAKTAQTEYAKKKPRKAVRKRWTTSKSWIRRDATRKKSAFAMCGKFTRRRVIISRRRRTISTLPGKWKKRRTESLMKKMQTGKRKTAELSTTCTSTSKKSSSPRRNHVLTSAACVEIDTVSSIFIYGEKQIGQIIFLAHALS